MFDVVGWILNVSLIMSFLERGGLVASDPAKIAMDRLVLLLSAISIPRVFPELRVTCRQSALRSFRELMAFGGRVFLSATTTRLAHHAQPMIISTAINAAAAAFFAIPVRLVDYVRQTSWTLTAAFMPMFSAPGQPRRPGDAQQDLPRLLEIHLHHPAAVPDTAAGLRAGLHRGSGSDQNTRHRGQGPCTSSPQPCCWRASSR